MPNLGGGRAQLSDCEDIAAAQQRTGKVRCRARPSEIHVVIAGAGPARAVRRVGTQSATHSARLPTMSKAPRAETQLLRAPVRDGEPSPEPDVLRAGVEMQVTLSCGAGGPQGPRGERGAREKALHGTKHAVLEEQAPVAAVWNHHHPPAWSACGGRGGHQGIVGGEDRELAVR